MLLGFDRRDEAIASPRQGLDEAWVFGGVSQSVPEPFDGGIQTVIKIDEGIGGPEPGPQFLTCDDLPRLFKKQAEDLEGLFLQANFGVLTPELAALQISFE